MEDRSIEMQAIFSKLSEQNKDIIILLAKIIKIAQESELPRKPPRQTARTM